MGVALCAHVPRYKRRTSRSITMGVQAAGFQNFASAFASVGGAGGPIAQTNVNGNVQTATGNNATSIQNPLLQNLAGGSNFQAAGANGATGTQGAGATGQTPAAGGQANGLGDIGKLVGQIGDVLKSVGGLLQGLGGG